MVLGGGCGAMAAVFALTDRKGWNDQYEITVYQPGWRLGGKGAAGRNAKAGDRIEEHGLHIWSGFYENAFWIMRKCYAELDRPATHPLASAFSAFRPRHYTGLCDLQNDDWVFWKGYLPHDTGLPGDFIDPDVYRAREEIRSPWSLFCEVVPWSVRYLKTTTNTTTGQQPERSGGPDWLINLLLTGKKWADLGWRERIKSVLDTATIGLIVVRLLWAFRRAKHHYAKAKAARAAAGTAAKPHTHTERPYTRLARRLECLQWWFHRRLDRDTGSDKDLRSFYMLGDIFVAMMIGMLRDGVIAQGFDCIDDRELREWLALHGAQKGSLQNPTVDAAYSYVFAFENGDTRRPKLAAGVAIRLLLRMLLCSRGAVFWEMQGGMGDTVFAPLYQALSRRGVKFRFFHRALKLSTRDGEHVDEIVLGRQATVRAAADAYRPLVDVKGLPAWPSHPDYAQLKERAELESRYGDGPCDLDSAYTDWPDVAPVTLRRGEQFDRVVLGTSIGPLAFICPTLLDKNPDLKRMVENVKTVRTQSMQLWATRSLQDLGWLLPPPIISAYGEPFDTWADLTGLLERENWSGPEYPRSLAYFCGAMRDDAGGVLGPGPRAAYARAAHDQVKLNARNWLAQFTSELWPRGTVPGTDGLDYQRLHRDGGGSDSERFDAQWFSANIDPGNRYVLSLPGTTRLRLKAGESGYRNLVLAGDWVRNGLNYGCVESAVLGGLQAARAICGHPERIYGENDVPADSAFATAGPIAGAADAPTPAPRTVVRDGSATAAAAPQSAATLASAAAPMANQYVRRGGMDVLPPPWRCDDVELHVFYLKGNPVALQAVCDRSLNAPSQGRLNYRLTSSFIVLTFQRLTDLYSVAPGCEEQGRHTYCEAAFWLLAAPHDRNNRPTGVPALMIPYIFAQSSLAVAAGREIYGYPKEWAAVQMPERGQPADDYRVRGLAVELRFVGAKAKPDTEILRCRRTNPLQLAGINGVLPGPQEDLWPAIQGGALATSPVALMTDFINVLLELPVGLVFLRQMRASQGGEGCDLQAAVSAVQDPMKIRGLRLLPDSYEVTLAPLDSHPIANDLGLVVAQPGNTVQVLMAIAIDLGFVLQPGRNL